MELSPNTWLDYLSTIAKKINHLKGTYVEMGFCKGITSYYTLYEMINNRIKKRDMWGFDSFKGFPHPSPHDNLDVAKKGHLTFPIKHALDFKTYAKKKHNINVNIIEGYFKDTIKQYNGGPIAILHLDVDLYDSYKICFETLYDLVIPGGLIMFDEYKSTTLLRWPGATKAIDEFLEDKNIEIKKHYIKNPYKTWKYGLLNSWKDIKLPRTPINNKTSGIGITKYTPTEKYYIYKPL